MNENQNLVRTVAGTGVALASAGAAILGLSAASFAASVAIGQLQRVFGVLVAPITASIRVVTQLASAFVGLAVSVGRVALTGVLRSIQLVAQSVTSIGRLASTAFGVFETAASGVNTVIQSLISGLSLASKGVTAVGSALFTVAQTSITAAGGLTGIVINAVAFAATASTIGAALFGLTTAIAVAFSVVKAAVNAITDGFGRLVAEFKNFGREGRAALDRIIEGLSQLGGIAATAIEVLVVSGLEQFQRLPAEAQQAWEGVLSAFEVGDFQNVFKTIANFASLQFLRIQKVALEAWQAIRVDLAGVFAGVISDLSSELRQAIEIVRTELLNIADQFGVEARRRVFAIKNAAAVTAQTLGGVATTASREEIADAIKKAAKEAIPDAQPREVKDVRTNEAERAKQVADAKAREVAATERAAGKLDELQGKIDAAGKQFDKTTGDIAKNAGRQAAIAGDPVQKFFQDLGKGTFAQTAGQIIGRGVVDLIKPDVNPDASFADITVPVTTFVKSLLSLGTETEKAASVLKSTTVDRGFDNASLAFLNNEAKEPEDETPDLIEQTNELLEGVTQAVDTVSDTITNTFGQIGKVVFR